MSKKCKAYSESKLGLEPPDNRKAFYAGWDAALVAAAEREACAKLCDDLHHDWRFGDGEQSASGPKECAKAIRARGKELSSQDNLPKSPTDGRYICHVCNRQEMVRAKFDEESG